MNSITHVSTTAVAATFTADITGFSHDGRGIASLNGKVTFIAGALVGEKVTFVYSKRHRQFDEGRAVDILSAAPERIAPICKHFGVCGGCSLQHMHPNAQIAAKQTILLEQLAHLGGVIPHHVLPPLQGPTARYRHKARLGVKYVHAKAKVLVGFRETNGRYLADIEHCAVLQPNIGEKITALSTFIASLAAYLFIPQIEVAVGDNATALIFRHLQPLSAQDLEKLSAFGATQQLHIYLQSGGPTTVTRLWPTQLTDPLLNYNLLKQNIQLRFHPTDFTQINPEINQQMISRAIELLNPQPQERVLDLFCGLGNFTLALARHCGDIIGIEGEIGLVKRATANAAHNQISNAQFHCVDLSKDFTATPGMQGSFDKILLDPPRTGALEAVKIIAKFKAKRILYVSCNPATLARDTKELIALGYRLTQAGVMDMFPHTSHVESMALFELN